MARLSGAAWLPIVGLPGVRPDHMSPFLRAGWRGLHGAPSAGPFVPASPHIYSWPRNAMPGDRNKLIHTSAHPVGLTWHLGADNKRTFQTV